MRKIRSDAKWLGLSQPQRATLEAWLFEDHLSYEAALARARAELRFGGSWSGLQRFHQRVARERALKELLASRNFAWVRMGPG
jgi:hypothetical protein